MSIERREFLKTAGVATAGMATGVVPPSPAIAQKRREAPGLGITSKDYINIADYGNVYPGANITAALQAALTVNGRVPVTGQPGFYTGTPKIYLIPDPGSDPNTQWQPPYLLDPASIQWRNTYPAILLIACRYIKLTSTFTIPGAMTIRGIVTSQGAGIGSRPLGPFFITTDNFTPALKIVSPNVLIEDIGVGPVNGDALRIQDTSCATIRNCSFATGNDQYAGLVIDGSFWINLEHVVLAAGGGGYNMKCIQTTPGNPPPAGLGLVVAKDIKPQAGKGILIHPTYSPAGSFVFENILHEGIATGAPLFDIDSTHQLVSDIKIIRPGLADYVKPSYLIKNTGGHTKAVYVEEPVLSGGQIMDSTSTEIDGFRIDMSNGVGALFWNGVFPSYAQKWRVDYPTHIDSKIVSLKQSPQVLLGTALGVLQDPANWGNDNHATITPGKIAPDGSTLAGEVVSQETYGASAIPFARTLGGVYQTVSVGDWFIAGGWVQRLASGSIWIDFSDWSVSGAGCAVNGGGGYARSLDAGTPAGRQDGGWLWVCEAFKLTGIGSGNFCPKLTLAQLGSAYQPARFFNPCLQYIRASAGFTDYDVIAYARSLTSGWASTLSASDVAVLNHQKFGLAGGARIYSATAAPTGTARKGDVCWNSAPAVGQPKGWQCTVSGTPGTWVSMGNL
jgi:hypothetical protein